MEKREEPHSQGGKGGEGAREAGGRKEARDQKERSEEERGSELDNVQNSDSATPSLASYMVFIFQKFILSTKRFLSPSQSRGSI